MSAFSSSSPLPVVGRTFWMMIGPFALILTLLTLGETDEALDRVRTVETDEVLDRVGKILCRCFILGLLFLFFWTVLYVTVGQKVFPVHGKMFGLTEHDLDVIHYCGIGLAKILVLVFFLFPYLAIRLAKSARKNGTADFPFGGGER